MSVTKEEALRAAIAFARSHGVTTRVLDALFVKGSTVDGTPKPEEDRWVFHFDRDLPRNIVMDPASVIVVVNNNTGEASMPSSV